MQHMKGEQQALITKVKCVLTPKPHRRHQGHDWGHHLVPICRCGQCGLPALGLEKWLLASILGVRRHHPSLPHIHLA
eukprot:4883345-Amphidinium_carterae.1